MRTRTPSSILLIIVLAGCDSFRSVTYAPPNPSAPGFLAAESDAEAIALADEVMLRMGGRIAWDQTRYLSWNFFGARRHVWDKHTNRIRVEGDRRDDGRPYVVIMDLDDGAGRAWIDGAEVTDDEHRRAMHDDARSAWINDSYWLVMPFKLKDTGVRLRDLGSGTMADGRGARVLELTFERVGDTPQNKYHVYVADDTRLVEQWDYFRDAADAAPRLTTPWHGWTHYGRIMLSGDRGERTITDIAVDDVLPASVFEGP